MKNVLKVSFFALALGLFAASCNNATKEGGDSTAIDSPAVETPVAPVDSPAVVAPVDSLPVVDSPATK